MDTLKSVAITVGLGIVGKTLADQYRGKTGEFMNPLAMYMVAILEPQRYVVPIAAAGLSLYYYPEFMNSEMYGYGVAIGAAAVSSLALAMYGPKGVMGDVV